MYGIVESLSGILYRRTYTCADMSHVRHVHHVLLNNYFHVWSCTSKSSCSSRVLRVPVLPRICIIWLPISPYAEYSLFAVVVRQAGLCVCVVTNGGKFFHDYSAPDAIRGKLLKYIFTLWSTRSGIKLELLDLSGDVLATYNTLQCGDMCPVTR